MGSGWRPEWRVMTRGEETTSASSAIHPLLLLPLSSLDGRRGTRQLLALEDQQDILRYGFTLADSPPPPPTMTTMTTTALDNAGVVGCRW